MEWPPVYMTLISSTNYVGMSLSDRYRKLDGKLFPPFAHFTGGQAHQIPTHQRHQQTLQLAAVFFALFIIFGPLAAPLWVLLQLNAYQRTTIVGT